MTPRVSPPKLNLQTFKMSFVSYPGLYQRDLYVMKTVVSRGVPVAAVIGGGYSRDIDELAIRHSIVHRAATQVQELLVGCPLRIVNFNNVSEYCFHVLHISGLEGVWDVNPSCPESRGLQSRPGT